jgi:hypothetical protein
MVICDISSGLAEAWEERNEEYRFTNWWKDGGKGNIHFDLVVYTEKTKEEWNFSLKVLDYLSLSLGDKILEKEINAHKINFSVSRMKNDKDKDEDKNK